jgi:hypothetical protein
MSKIERPCDCGKEIGNDVFTICDECWEKEYPKCKEKESDEKDELILSLEKENKEIKGMLETSVGLNMDNGKQLQKLKEFIRWYSGMEQSKIDKAYQRFLKETNKP